MWRFSLMSEQEETETLKPFVIDFEHRDEGPAFYALYAGLRMFYEKKMEQHQGTDSISIAGAEAYCLLQEIKEQYPKEFAEAEHEYSEPLPLTDEEVATPKIHVEWLNADTIVVKGTDNWEEAEEAAEDFVEEYSRNSGKFKSHYIPGSQKGYKTAPFEYSVRNEY